MKRIVTLSLVLVLLTAVCSGALAGEEKYNFMAPAQVKQLVEAQGPITLLDIQAQDSFCEHHIPGAVATYAYPVKSEGDKARLDTVLARLGAGQEPIVIVCPRGGGGAKRAYDHLVDQGIAVERLFILEKGQEGWPYPELTEKTPKP